MVTQSRWEGGQGWGCSVAGYQQVLDMTEKPCPIASGDPDETHRESLFISYKSTIISRKD